MHRVVIKCLCLIITKEYWRKIAIALKVVRDAHMEGRQEIELR